MHKVNLKTHAQLASQMSHQAVALIYFFLRKCVVFIFSAELNLVRKCFKHKLTQELLFLFHF